MKQFLQYSNITKDQVLEKPKEVLESLNYAMS